MILKMKMIDDTNIDDYLPLKKNGYTVHGVNIEKKDRSVSTSSYDAVRNLSHWQMGWRRRKMQLPWMMVSRNVILLIILWFWVKSENHQDDANYFQAWRERARQQVSMAARSRLRSTVTKKNYKMFNLCNKIREDRLVQDQGRHPRQIPRCDTHEEKRSNHDSFCT